jgi:hypothetical protein
MQESRGFQRGDGADELGCLSQRIGAGGRMGIMRHEAVIATISEYAMEPIIAFRGAMPEHRRRFLTGPIVGINSVATFVFVPDGSQEGWPQSENMYEIRAGFIRLLKAVDADWAHVVLYDENFLQGVPREDRVTPWIEDSSRLMWMADEQGWEYERDAGYQPTAWPFADPDEP